MIWYILKVEIPIHRLKKTKKKQTKHFILNRNQCHSKYLQWIIKIKKGNIEKRSSC